MALYVVQHGKNLPKTEDPQKGLTEEGKKETERIAEVAAGYQVRVSRIFHSGKKRARETAEIFSVRLSPTGGIESCGGMNPMDDVRAFVANLPLDQNIMLVGHLPFMQRLIGLLVCGDPEQTIFKLQNSGILCLDSMSGEKNPFIRWALMPSVG